jgi:hypothetical protein
LDHFVLGCRWPDCQAQLNAGFLYTQIIKMLTVFPQTFLQGMFVEVGCHGGAQDFAWQKMD